MVEYAVMLLATSLVAMSFLKAVGHRASFGVGRARSVLSTEQQGGTERPPAAIEKIVKVEKRRAGVAQ